VRLAVLAAAACLCACGPPCHASSTFEGDADGWVVQNNGTDDTVSLMASGGNPRGNICGQDKADGDTWYFVAPAKYTGNVSDVYGKRLTFDLKQGSIFNQIRGRDVILNGGGLSLVYNIKFAPGLDWTPYSVTIDDSSGWTEDDQTGKGPPATADDFNVVLKNLTSLRIRGEFYDGPNDTACLDNVYFGTP